MHKLPHNATAVPRRFFCWALVKSQQPAEPAEPEIVALSRRRYQPLVRHPKTGCAHKYRLKAVLNRNPNRPPVSSFTAPYFRPPATIFRAGRLPIGGWRQYHGIIRQLILIFVKVILWRRFSDLFNDFRIIFISFYIQIVDWQKSDFVPPGISKVKKVI